MNNIEFLKHKEIFAAKTLAMCLAQRQTPEDKKGTRRNTSQWAACYLLDKAHAHTAPEECGRETYQAPLYESRKNVECRS